MKKRTQRGTRERSTVFKLRADHRMIHQRKERD
ncbi:hypothetical protein COLO4_20520 [Corchorus olitorius]|uniref:Uncharacterized protein n=1 Tax=Corchorus olitorius TaxID=93759 RepID=A0A1R3IZF1_9ROSI|nr:hypothetical protein COLO4_20520 [Corchorus olitorius]